MSGFVKGSNKILLYDLLSRVITVDERDDFVLRLSDFISDLFGRRGEISDKIEKNFSFAEREKLLELIKRKKLDLNNALKLEKFINNIRQEVKNMEVLKLVVGFEISSEQLSKISAWLIRNLDRKIILDVTIDKSIVGGATIIFKGKYKDYSLKKYVEENLKNYA